MTDIVYAPLFITFLWIIVGVAVYFPASREYRIDNLHYTIQTGWSDIPYQLCDGIVGDLTRSANTLSTK